MKPVKPFTNRFAIEEDLMLMEKSTGLFWGEEGWTDDLTKVVRAGTKTELRGKIPWYSDLAKEYYRAKYYIEKGIPLKEGMRGEKDFHLYCVMCQSNKKETKL